MKDFPSTCRRLGSRLAWQPPSGVCSQQRVSSQSRQQSQPTVAKLTGQVEKPWVVLVRGDPVHCVQSPEIGTPDTLRVVHAALDEDPENASIRRTIRELDLMTISIAKAGITTILNSRASVLAAANPVFGTYDDMRSAAENIDFLPTILSRFDLIYLILDNPDRDSDRRLAKHIVELYLAPPEPGSTEEQARKVQAPADERFLRDYVAFARARIHPELGPEARSELVERLGRRSSRQRSVVAIREARSLLVTRRSVARDR